jgi:hypothetical protein
MDNLPFWLFVIFAVYLGILAFFERDDWGE